MPFIPTPILVGVPLLGLAALVWYEWSKGQQSAAASYGGSPSGGPSGGSGPPTGGPPTGSGLPSGSLLPFGPQLPASGLQHGQPTGFGPGPATGIGPARSTGPGIPVVSLSSPGITLSTIPFSTIPTPSPISTSPASPPSQSPANPYGPTIIAAARMVLANPTSQLDVFGQPVASVAAALKLLIAVPTPTQLSITLASLQNSGANSAYMLLQPIAASLGVS